MLTEAPERRAKPRPDTAASHERAVQRVICEMRTHLDEHLSLEAMAEVAIMSPFHFNRTFHSVTGLPPRLFLSAMRLERARHLLLTTPERVTDVCFDVGYNSLGTFTRRFTELLGVPPRRLRSYRSSGIERLWADAGPPVRSQSATGGVVRGHVLAPPEFDGAVFVGLFTTSLPYGAPVACRLLQRGGPFTLNAPTGRYHVYAVGVRHPERALELLMFDDALRGRAGVIDVADSPEPASLEIALRPRSDFDPPILVTLPLLLSRRAALRMARRGLAEAVA